MNQKFGLLVDWIRTHTVGDDLHRLDVRIEIVEDDVSLVCPDDEHQVVLTRARDNFRKKERARWPTLCEQFMALGNCVIVAITGDGVNPPLFGEHVAFITLWNNIAIDLAVYGRKLNPAFCRKRYCAAPEIDSAPLAILRILQTKASIGHRREDRNVDLDHSEPRRNPRLRRLVRFRVRAKCPGIDLGKAFDSRGSNLLRQS